MSNFLCIKDLRHQDKVITVRVDKSFHLLMEHHSKATMDILPINRDNLPRGSLGSRVAILPTRNHIVDIMVDLPLQIIDIHLQHHRRTTHKDLLVPLQVLDIIRTHHLEETFPQVHLHQEVLLTHIHLLEILILVIILHILTAISLLVLVPIIHHLRSLVQLLDIPLNLYHNHLKTRIFHQNHQMHLQEGKDRPLPMRMPQL